MERHLKHLSDEERKFIDLVYIQLRPFKEVSEILKVEYKRIQELNINLDNVWRPISKIRGKWKLKEIGGDFWDFYDWYKTHEERCHYCGITQNELDKLHELKITNKRKTRGKILEIDRKMPNEKYSNLSNLTYSCYWCNNAKTDTFTEDEFMIIGDAISKVWKNRLKNDN